VRSHKRSATDDTRVTTWDQPNTSQNKHKKRTPSPQRMGQ